MDRSLSDNNVSKLNSSYINVYLLIARPGAADRHFCEFLRKFEASGTPSAISTGGSFALAGRNTALRFTQSRDAQIFISMVEGKTDSTYGSRWRQQTDAVAAISMGGD